MNNQAISKHILTHRDNQNPIQQQPAFGTNFKGIKYESGLALKKKEVEEKKIDEEKKNDLFSGIELELN